MKLCQAHWNRLLESIHAEGLGELVPKDRLDLVCRTRSRKADGVNPSNFDPIALANDIITIWSIRGICQSDLYHAARECPICLFDVPQWIGKACHESGELWKQLSAI
jgi:hypothetical protein